MTNDEIIARWRGWERKDGWWVSRDGRGELWVVSILLWVPSLDIAPWHGEGGLLKEIERKGIAGDFYKAVGRLVAPDIARQSIQAAVAIGWRILQATPAQLTEALVALIKEGGG